MIRDETDVGFSAEMFSRSGRRPFAADLELTSVSRIEERAADLELTTASRIEERAASLALSMGDSVEFKLALMSFTAVILAFSTSLTVGCSFPTVLMTLFSTVPLNSDPTQKGAVKVEAFLLDFVDRVARLPFIGGIVASLNPAAHIAQPAEGFLALMQR